MNGGRTMKRYYAIMLTLAMIFSLCACGAASNSMKTEAAPAEPMAAADMAYSMNTAGGFGMAEEAMEAYEAQFPDWNKVVLVPVKTIKDSNKNIVNYRHDLSLNSTRLVGGEDAILIKVITSAFNQ